VKIHFANFLLSKVNNHFYQLIKNSGTMIVEVGGEGKQIRNTSLDHNPHKNYAK